MLTSDCMSSGFSSRGTGVGGPVWTSAGGSGWVSAERVCVFTQGALM